MDIFDSRYLAYRLGGKAETAIDSRVDLKEQNNLKAEFPVAKFEEVTKGRPAEIKNKRIIVSVGTEPSDNGHARLTFESDVNFAFMLKPRVLGPGGFELDCKPLPGDDVHCQVNVT